MAEAVDRKSADKAPLPEDDEMECQRPGKRGSDGGSPSPRRQKPAAVSVDVETLRNLLAEQSAQLLEKVMQGQREQVEGMAADLRREMKQGNEVVANEVREQGQQLRDLQTDHRQVLQRLEKLEREGSTTASTSAEPDLEKHNKFSLIFGGWPRDTARRTVVDQLHKALQDLNLAGSTDFPGFTTGPRRAVALMQFKIRHHEQFQGMRERMANIIGTVNRGSVALKNGGKLWCSFSKTKPERDRGSHAALVRRVIRQVAAHQEGDLEAEYGTGSTWWGEYKFSSAVEAAPVRSDGTIMEFDALQPGAVCPWIDIGAVAECFQVTTKLCGRPLRRNGGTDTTAWQMRKCLTIPGMWVGSAPL